MDHSRQSINLLDEYYDLLGVDFETIKTNFECEQRLAITENTPIPDSEDDVVVHDCLVDASHQHLYRKSYLDNEKTYWNEIRQFAGLDAYRSRLAQGSVEGRKKENLTLGAKKETEADILFRRAPKYCKDLKISREELIRWYVCERKVAHNSMRDAETSYLTHAHSEKLNAYHCSYNTAHFHVGHISTNGRPDMVEVKKKYLSHKRWVKRHSK